MSMGLAGAATATATAAVLGQSCRLVMIATLFDSFVNL